MTSTYHFPLLFLIPRFDEAEIQQSSFRIAKRRWNTSTFDLATLATKHKLHLPYQVMDVLLSRCNLELSLQNHANVEEAIESFHTFRLAMYVAGSSPFLSPFVTTHSINEYSGINSRDSEILRKRLDPAMLEGLRSDTDTLEAWPVELSLQCILVEEGLDLSADRFAEAALKADRWRRLLPKMPLLKVVSDAANAAPKLLSPDQSLLHVWSALEALFPTVNTELSFRIALYLAQLIGSKTDRIAWFDKARASYGLRSKVTHGSKQNISSQEWRDTWLLLMEAVNAIILRGKLPSEQDLISEMLS